jgi:hypothetical protein
MHPHITAIEPAQMMVGLILGVMAVGVILVVTSTLAIIGTVVILIRRKKHKRP